MNLGPRPVAPRRSAARGCRVALPATFGVRHTYTGIKHDNQDGSLTLFVLRDGVELLRFTEHAGSLPANSPVLRGGREGFRSNMTHWNLDSYGVTVTP